MFSASFRVRANEGSDSQDDQSLSIPWQKPPSKRSRQILLPHNASRSDVRPEKFERRARLVSAIARGRRWLDDVVSGRVTTVAQLCAREKCSVRQVNMTISLAFLGPNLVKAAWKVACPAASASSGSATRRPNGASSSRRSDSIRNSCNTGPPEQRSPKSRNCRYPYKEQRQTKEGVVVVGVGRYHSDEAA